ncbi:hypothetical protein JW992_11190 [candidate division KSB1 bacterium]|nr:hypothetical protein [candidate division KSB1 bacterium]
MMEQYLLNIEDYEPPMGDLGIKQRLAFVRALWTLPLAEEKDAPEHRIIHAKILQPHTPVRLHRLGLHRGRGYHKCGSRMDLDWVVDFRLMVLQHGQWQVRLYKRNLPLTDETTIQTFDLDGLVVEAAILEIRRCGIDGWWPSWNLASSAFILEGEILGDLAPRRELALQTGEISFDRIPTGLTVEHRDGQVIYRSPFLQVGFYLNRAGFSFLGLDQSGGGNTGNNLLRIQPGAFYQGMFLHPVGQQALSQPTVRYDVTGNVQIADNRVRYDLTCSDSGVQYELDWLIEPDNLRATIVRIGEKPLRAWTSAAWMMAFYSLVSPTHVIGAVTREGETGLVAPSVLLHAPRYGTLQIESTSENTVLRADAIRPIDLTTLEIKVGEIPQPEGDYLLPAGRFQSEWQMRAVKPQISLYVDTPPEVQEAVDKTAFTALTYRPDTATLSNNGVSMHCPICMDMWSAIVTRMGKILPNLHAVDLLKSSLERWLDGASGYTSGRLLQGGEMHDAEDEYLMTGTACLLGLSDYLRHSGTPQWLQLYHRAIAEQIEKMRQRDLDGDGLIESPYRTGISGTGQWSTCWWDVISFGWKDAFANALLYPALRNLADVLPRLGAADLAADLSDWANLLKRNYFAVFYNPSSGWLAGWRCKEDRLHDYAFLFVNGAAVNAGLVDPPDAGRIIRALWNEAERLGLPDPFFGLPGNMWKIPDEDCADILTGYPLGYYQNGGRTHSQARHFLKALYTVGMEKEADFLLRRLCAGLADGRVFGGSKSGVDWRFWNDQPCGYEGLLTDQFGVLAVVLERYCSHC